MKTMLCGIALAAAVLAQGPPVPQGGAPAALIITYRCPPPRRAAFRQYMSEFGLPRFEHWRQEGVLQDYRFLFNWYVDADTWDAMAVLSFANFQQSERWADVEKGNPGGLAQDALEMAWPLNTYSADIVARASADTPRSLADRVFYVAPYDAPAADFREYANSFLAPQAMATMREGILASYAIFANRYNGGKRWQGLIVIEYKDAGSFARREDVGSKVRAQLREDAAWRAAGEKGKSITEREAVIASAVTMR